MIGAQVAAVDEICELEGCPMEATDDAYVGTLDDDEFGVPLKVRWRANQRCCLECIRLQSG
jgi:hypothetical protein